MDYTHPFGHRPLVEFLMAVPPDVLCRPGEPRRLNAVRIVRSVAALAAHAAIERFVQCPVAGSVTAIARTLLDGKPLHLVERGLVDGASVRSRLERLGAGLDCNQSQLRNIILLELWLRERPS